MAAVSAIWNCFTSVLTLTLPADSDLSGPGSFVGACRSGVDVRVVHLEPLLNPYAISACSRKENVTLLQTHGAQANFMDVWLVGWRGTGGDLHGPQFDCRLW